MICWLNSSEPVRVHAEGVPAVPEAGLNTTAATATVRFANGAVAALVLTEAGENPHVGKWLHEIFDGTRSAVLYDHFRQVRFSGAACDHYAAPEDLRTDGTYGVLENFVESITRSVPPRITARDGLRATTFARRILDSLHAQAPVEVALDGAA
jgi:hypothetical protein